MFAIFILASWGIGQIAEKRSFGSCKFLFSFYWHYFWVLAITICLIWQCNTLYNRRNCFDSMDCNSEYLGQKSTANQPNTFVSFSNQPSKIQSLQISMYFVQKEKKSSIGYNSIYR